MTNPDDVAPAVVESNAQVAADRELLRDARRRGFGASLAAFTKLSGPGWLQSAITLGGGSLSGSLYLGVLAGYGLMWLQPLAMLMGVIMLSAIAYVTLSTGERPFRAINQHINPVLGWGWAIATLLANLVWCMPQFALGTAALTQNLFPEFLGPEGPLSPGQAKALCSGGLFVCAAVVVWFYDSGGRGIRIFEGILKAMVGVVVICFFGVVIKMSLEGVLNWTGILRGFIPDLRLLAEPADSLKPIIAETGAFADFWSRMVVRDQQDVMITAAATAVGINMTFLLPYSMLAKGWDREFRGLAAFDLSTGLFIPFMLATSCVVLAAASQFHAQPEPGLYELYEPGAVTNETKTPPAGLVKGYKKLLDSRIQAEAGANPPEDWDAARAALPAADRRFAAMLVKRDAFNLANALERIAGKTTAQYLFGIGVLGMAVSTIIILMLINGFTVCEMAGVPAQGTIRRLGAMLPGITGIVGAFAWNEASVYLAVPTSLFGMMLLPIAYWTFFLMLNSRALMGTAMPRGLWRVAANLAMGLAAGLATFGSFWSIKSSAYPVLGGVSMAAFLGLALLVHVKFPRIPDRRLAGDPGRPGL